MRYVVLLLLASDAAGQTPQYVKQYNLLPISAVLLILYTASFLLSRRKVIAVATHRMIWNLMLTVTFLAAAATGVLLILRINYGFYLPFPDLLHWHVEAGIAMAVISVFHIVWHWPYYKCIITRSAKKCD